MCIACAIICTRVAHKVCLKYEIQNMLPSNYFQNIARHNRPRPAMCMLDQFAPKSMVMMMLELLPIYLRDNFLTACNPANQQRQRQTDLTDNSSSPAIVGDINPLIATLQPQSNGPSYSNIVIGTLAVDGWAVTFSTARRGLGGAEAHPGPSSLYQM